MIELNVLFAIIVGLFYLGGRFLHLFNINMNKLSKFLLENIANIINVEECLSLKFS